jgi:ribonuclease HI
VGDGKKIKLLTDNWIPGYRPGSFKLLTPIPNGATVDFLLDEDHCSWDAHVVRSVFEEDIADQVLQIPISRRGGEDFVSWPFTRFSDYTVSSAYNLARKDKFFLDRSKQGGGANSGTEADSIFWKKLWSIKAPGKMKINLWRFAHDCLPSGVQLCRRHIPVSASCSYCNREESIEHVFLFCHFSREVWQEIKMRYNVQLCRKSFSNTKTWLHDFMLRSSDRERMIFAVVAWHLWINRNAIKNGETMRGPHSVAAQALAYAEMIEEHLFRPVSSSRCDTSLSSPRWSPPPEGTVMINTDAAIFSSSRQMGVGVVIRNHNGECIAACSELVDAVTSPELAEALAVRRAISLAGEEGFGKVLVVSDCLSVIQRINSTVIDRSVVGVIVQDIKHSSGSFEEISFSHVRRHLNESAHILARSAKRFISSTFRNFAPDCIRKTLCNDLL